MATNSAQDERNAQAIIEGIGKVWSRKLGVAGLCIYLISQVPDESAPWVPYIKIGAYALVAVAYLVAQGRVDAAKAGGGFILVDDSETAEQGESAPQPPRSAN
ncbi:hypothetical protein KDL45_17245 [bacterium]|nr:hypothetical protein [bacterium]